MIHETPAQADMLKTDILPLANKPYRFGILVQPSDAKEDSKADTKNTHLQFFSGAEAHLCLEITQAIEKNHQTIFVELPSFAQDNALAERIAHYIQIPKSQSVVIDAKGLNATQIIKEYIKQLSLDTDNDTLFQEFAKLMTYYFQHNQVLHSVIYNAQFLQKQDFDYLYELSNLIYEKFPKERHKPLIRFVFIGNKLVFPILKHKTNGYLKHLHLPLLTHTECVNALYLYTPLLERTELFYQTVANNAAALRGATAGYPALLRYVLPLPIAPSLADKKTPEGYLSKVIDRYIDVGHHTELSYRRTRLGGHYNRTSNHKGIIILSVILVMVLGYCLV